MSPQEFEISLKAEHFDEVVAIDRAVGYALGEHRHPFDACALITAGDFTLVVDGVSTNYAVGDIFRLSAGIAHHENAGPAGASYLAGRRQVAAL